MTVGRLTRRSLNGEVDDELQRGSRGKRRRYFLAAVVRREQDAQLKRLHVHSLRPPDAVRSRQPPGTRLALPMPAFMPLAANHDQQGKDAAEYMLQHSVAGCSTLDQLALCGGLGEAVCALCVCNLRHEGVMALQICLLSEHWLLGFARA